MYSYFTEYRHSPPHIRGAKLVTFFRLANKTCIFFKENVLYNIFSPHPSTHSHTSPNTPRTIGAPLAYIYMTLKVVNYLPRKIDEMRAINTKPAETPTEKSLSLKKNGLEEKIGGYVNRWIEEKRYCSPELSIKDVALQIGTNHNYLSQYLNDYLGVTFQMWLNTLRIEESKNILTSENISIEEVGIKVGIPESYNFSRWFKVVTGTTPLRYRKEANQAKTN